jgi:hypothetical protein
MFIVRNQQIEAFRSILEENFIVLAQKHLEENYPNKSSSLTKESLEMLIRKGIDESATYGVIERPEVLIYLEYVLCLGLNFSASPEHIWIKRTLKISNIDGAEKMQRIQNIKTLKPEFD